MKLLLTSAGIKNRSIHTALLDMLGKPIAECSALCIPTAIYALPGGSLMARRFICGQEPQCPMCELGWKSLGVLELTALPSLKQETWLPTLQAADVLLVNGGDPLYLCYWMRQSGLADLLPSLDVVYVGLSAGSMVMTPRIGPADQRAGEILKRIEGIENPVGVEIGVFAGDTSCRLLQHPTLTLYMVDSWEGGGDA